MSKRLVFDMSEPCGTCASCERRLVVQALITRVLDKYAPLVEAAYGEWTADRQHATYMNEHQPWSTSARIASGDRAEASRQRLNKITTECDQQLAELCKNIMGPCFNLTLRPRITEDCTDEGRRY